MNYGFEIARVFGYLLLVLVIIYISQHFFRKFLRQQRQGEHLEMIEQLYISPKRSLALFRAREQILLLGISEKGIEKIASWDIDEFELTEKESSKANPKFMEYLKKFSSKYRRDNNE